ncbi:MAG: 1,4-dihydroxy-2-naphthoyl-CoA hydrolase [Actinomycetota bacterium]|jgi:uncharacterized protein (TIGR00369 family)|nr:1,4-dihydroxy-2-naphthoyl-CoA hydrolase [Actinomycetota bacterium]
MAEPRVPDPATSAQPPDAADQDPVAVLEFVSQLGVGTLVERMGIEFSEATPQRLVATMPVEGNTQPYGLLHGGASMVLVETLGSIGAALHAGRDAIAVGVDINGTHHRAVRSGRVTGTATPLHLGSTVVTYQVAVTDDAERLVCTARITCLVRPRRSAG